MVILLPRGVSYTRVFIFHLIDPPLGADYKRLITQHTHTHTVKRHETHRTCAVVEVLLKVSHQSIKLFIDINSIGVLPLML